MEEAFPIYRRLIERHHTAMLAADVEAVMALRQEVSKLARKLNKGDPGVLAGPDETVPLWGQADRFIVETEAMRVGIETDGIFGIDAGYMVWPGFSAHAVDWDKPFLSQTGYRSFFGLGGVLAPGQNPNGFSAHVVADYVKRGLKGRLAVIGPEHRPKGYSESDGKFWQNMP